MTKVVECPYKSAEELGISEEERQGLIDLIPRLLAGVEDFDMKDWDCCIKGRLDKALGRKIGRSTALDELYCWSMGMLTRPAQNIWGHCSHGPGSATSQQGAVAVVRFLSGSKQVFYDC